MANHLTGDYEAVLQVSEATVNRLLASMHQNAWRDRGTPSIPHSVGLRLGDDQYMDGVQGTAWAQIGVPHFDLIDGSTDAFDLTVDLRIRYLPDLYSTPLPMYMKGPLRARYQVTDIDPSSIPWGRVASDYLWFRVVEDSVSFDGVYSSDDWVSIDSFVFDKAETDAAMARYLATLLTTKFEATPNKVTDQFSRHLFKSVIQTDGAFSEASDPPAPDVEIGGRAVLVPLSLSGAPPTGALDSLEHVLLRGKDFAVAVGYDVIEGTFQPAIDVMTGYRTETEVDLLVGTAVYEGSIDRPSVAWQPDASGARIVLTAVAHLRGPGLPKLDPTITQPLRMEFDRGGPTLTLWAEATSVDLGWVEDLPFGVGDRVKARVESVVHQIVSAEIGKDSVKAALRSIAAGSRELAGTLQKMDGWADARFDEASFYASGIVFRGGISVASRRAPEFTFENIGDGFSALQSWIPGGRIDELQWSWTFAWGSVFVPTDPENVKNDRDRYVLTRQLVEPNGFKVDVGSPLPGIDRSGQVCLHIKGHRVNSRTGVLEEFDDFETDVCQVFGHPIPLQPGADGLDIPEYIPVGGGGPHHPGPIEIGVARIGHQVLTLEAANTLVVSVGGSFDDTDAEVIVAGVAACTRQDAGLLVTLVFPQGGLDKTDAQLSERLQSFADRLRAPVAVREDLDGAISKALSVDNRDGGATWQLFSPGGSLLWKREGRIEADELSKVLDGCLYASAPAKPITLHADRRWSAEELGALFDTARARRDGGGARGPSPAASSLREADISSIVSEVSFVQQNPDSSKRELARLRADNAARGPEDPPVLLVVDGASEEEAERMGKELGPAFIVIPDPDGALAAEAGVRFWPTTVAVGNQEGGA